MTALSNHVAELLIEDDAYLLTSRVILRLRGRKAREPLLECLTNGIPDPASGAIYGVSVYADGCVSGDLFLISDGDDLLVDCDRSQTHDWIDRIQKHGGEVIDESEEWRVFGLLNNQSVFDDGTPYIRYADPRRHELGSRVLRPITSRESLSWRHEGKWRAHAYRLGIADSALFARTKIGVYEAGLHRLNALHPARLCALGLPPEQEGLAAVRQRLLPFRVEPSGPALPSMVGEPITGDGLAIGTVVARQGLFGLALIDLDSWRKAIVAGTPFRCAGEQVLPSWPTWIGDESLGRGSPAAKADPKLRRRKGS